MINFCFFFENCSLHKDCRALSDADSDSASSSASESVAPMARQYFLGVDNWGYSWWNTWKWSISDLFSRIPVFTSIVGQFWMQIQIQHQILHPNLVYRWPGNISLWLIIGSIHHGIPRNDQFLIFFSRISLFTSIAGQFWMPIRIQHQILHLNQLHWWPGNISLRLIIRVIHSVLPRNDQFLIFFRELLSSQVLPGSFECRFRFSIKFCIWISSTDLKAIFPCV